MAVLAVTVVAGQPESAWCEQCSTSSAVHVPIYALHRAGVSRIATWTGCTKESHEATHGPA